MMKEDKSRRIRITTEQNITGLYIDFEFQTNYHCDDLTNTNSLYFITRPSKCYSKSEDAYTCIELFARLAKIISPTFL